MVIADPVSTIPAAAADDNWVPESFTLGDCLTDTLTGNLDVFRLRNIALSSGCARDDVPTRHLRLQHGSAHVRPRLSLLRHHHTGHRHRDIRHQELADQGDAIRVRESDGSERGMSPVPHLLDRWIWPPHPDQDLKMAFKELENYNHFMFHVSNQCTVNENEGGYIYFHPIIKP